MSAEDLFIGLMSGTSADAIDAVLVRIADSGYVEHIAHESTPMPETLATQIFALQTGDSRDIHDVCTLDVNLAQLYADTVAALLQKCAVSSSDVVAIGNHGQTLLHYPDSDPSFTLQVGDNHRLAELTGIDVVGDFRRRDLAAGGQAAPLIPAFHRALMQSKNSVAFVNIGGIANVTVLRGEETLGFDTGPGNTLMDAWIRREKNQPYDNSGAWARTGVVNKRLLAQMLADPYFVRPAPKSTGQDFFNLEWLAEKITSELSPEDIQRTLLELTAITTSDAVLESGSEMVFIFGGGRHNEFLIERIQDLLGEVPLASTLQLGVDPDYMEATAFAWLAKQRLQGKPGNDPRVTGAKGKRLLGVIFPA